MVAPVDRARALPQNANVAVPPRLLAPRTALLHEQRYRRQFLPADRRQNAAAILIVGVALFVATLNDLLLLRGSWLLYVAVPARFLILAVTVVASVLLLHAKRSRQHDLACTLWLLTSSVCYLPVILTRIPSGEHLGVLLSLVIILSIYYFAMRGLLWPRVAAAGIGTFTLTIFLWSSRAASLYVAINAATIGFIGLNFVGIVSARSFEQQRRKQFEAERQERQARQELAIKLRELAVAKDLADAMLRARAAFAATMSHEFRTPMNAVVGLSDLLLDMRLAPEGRAYVQTISDSARALLAMLNDVLDFAQIDAQKLRLSPVAFDLHRLCSSVINMLQPVAKVRAIELAADLSPKLPPWLLGDDARLRQVLVNLVSNAIKFTERGSVWLKVTTRAVEASQHEINVLVEDTGIGIAPEAVARLFRPFEQVDAGIARRYGGTGLGLTISRQIVLAMGGDIQVESTAGHGSRFCFSLRFPVAAAQSGDHRSLLDSPPLSRPPMAVLVVDDHPINREVAQAKLGRLGYPADLASDGHEAIAAVDKKPYDVVFMDLQMPGMSGLETTQRIVNRLAGKRLPHIVALTASVFEEDRETCRRAGMCDFLGKPIESEQLDAVLVRVAAERAVTTFIEPVVETTAEGALEKLREVEKAGEPHFVAKLCQIFLTDTRKRLPRMVEALGRGDAPTLEQEAHALRSACATIGATDMAALCEQIERVTREGSTLEVGAWLAALTMKFPEIERALGREIPAQGGDNVSTSEVVCKPRSSSSMAESQ